MFFHFPGKKKCVYKKKKNYGGQLRVFRDLMLEIKQTKKLAESNYGSPVIIRVASYQIYRGPNTLVIPEKISQSVSTD